MVCAFDHRYVKRAIWRMKCTVTELEGLGATHAVHLRLIRKLVGDFLLVIIELFFARCFHFVTIHAFDGQTDRQNFDSKVRSSI